MMQEHGRLAMTEDTGEPDLHRRRLEQVLAADHEIDSMPHVVDDDAEPVRPVAVPIPDREIAGERDKAGTRAESSVLPGLLPVTEGDAKRRAGSRRKPPLGAAARTPGTHPRSSARPFRRGERRARAVAGVDATLVGELRQRSGVDVTRVAL